MKDAIEFSQALRWGIPGWILFVVVALLLTIDSALGGKTSLPAPASLLARDSFAAALLVAGAGVPVGYLLYQVYFCWRWNSRWSGKDIRIGSFEVQQGRIAGIRQTLQGVGVDKKIKKPIWLGQYVAYLNRFLKGGNTDYRRAWNYMEIILLEFGTRDEASKILYERSRYLLDMLHGLGVCMWAVFCGGLFWFIAKIHFYIFNLYPAALLGALANDLVGYIAVGVLLTGFYLVLHRNFMNTRSQVIDVQNHLLKRNLSNKRILRSL